MQSKTIFYPIQKKFFYYFAALQFKYQQLSLNFYNKECKCKLVICCSAVTKAAAPR